MKRFWGFVIKEFHHIFRDRRTLLILFGMPIAQMMLFGYVITNELKDVKLAVLDNSKDNTTQRIIEKLTSSGYFVLERNLKSEDEIASCLREGKIREIIVFEPEFEKKLEREGMASVHIITDASEANTASLMYSYTSGIIQDFVNKENRSQVQPMQITTKSRMMYNENLESVFMFVPGTMAMILMLISALLTSISIVREKELGTMEVLLVSPLKPIQIVVGKVTPYVVLSFINAVSIITLGYFVFGLPVAGSLLLLMAECMLFIMMALSLGILISTSTNSQQTAMFLSMLGLMLPTILLSGFIYPIENMPKVLQWLCYIVPPRYFIIIIKNIMLKGTGFAYVWKETLVLLGMTLFFIALSARKFKVRLQ
jgi:ABC-2 type transport system permease protein